MKAARLVVLTIAIGAGGIAAILAGRSEKVVEVKLAPQVASVDILVAKSDISLGQKITPANVQWQPWPANAAIGNFVRRTDRPQAIEQLSDNIARYPFVAGEPIREAKLVDAKGSGFMAAILLPGMRAISTQISAETSAGGFILPNDHVDVILSHRTRDVANEAANGSHNSETILSNVRVLAIDQNVQEKDGQKVVVGKTATLELTPLQAEALAQAQQDGTLALVLRSMSEATRDGPKLATPPMPNDHMIVMYRGTARESFTCNPDCLR
ncbi:MAG TPA: Flp pilus assembly protein CpaB [Candidatus Limnocylindrales bacterium]|nr:Flp pilus assembly protein CpaB [Candidatus Limnocylindrales bacterium]